jgi:hypothetical protein
MVSTAQDIMRRYGIDQDFASSIESLGNDLGVDPMYLANTMYAESTLNPSEKNKAGSKAMGLIQFMPKTAANLGTTTDELSRMTPVEQMEYVRRYFSADNLGAGRLRALRNDPSQHNVNMAVFLPSMIGKPVDTQIPQEVLASRMVLFGPLVIIQDPPKNGLMLIFRAILRIHRLTP